MSTTRCHPGLDYVRDRILTLDDNVTYAIAMSALHSSLMSSTQDGRVEWRRIYRTCLDWFHSNCMCACFSGPDTITRRGVMRRIKAQLQTAHDRTMYADLEGVTGMSRCNMVNQRECDRLRRLKQESYAYFHGRGYVYTRACNRFNVLK